MKIKIHFKGLDDNKEEVFSKIKNFYKDKYFLKVEKETKPEINVLSWKEFLPGFGTNASDHILSIDWKEYTVYQVKNSEYEPFSNKELKFFDKLGFELDSSFANFFNQDITDWTNE